MRQNLNYSTKSINRNFRIKVCGHDASGKRINKLVGVAGAIALLAFIIYRVLRPKLKEEKPSDEQILQDEMNRMLQDVDDPEAARQISNYKEDE